MKAVLFRDHGGLEVLQYEEVDDPTPGPGEVLMEVRAVSVNPGPDAMTRSQGFGYPGFQLPHVTGSDPAGDIVAVGEGVSRASVGDRAVVYPVLRCGVCSICRAGRPANYCRNFRMFGVHTWGGRADRVIVPEDALVFLPETVSYEAAATLPVTYITTWHGLVDRAQLKKDDTLLIVGAGGGCGVAAVQIANHIGARAIALTGSAEKAARLRDLGVASVLSYRDEDWPAQVRALTGHGVAVAFDNSGTQTWARSISCLDRGGRLSCSGATTGVELDLDVRDLYREQVSLLFNVQGSKENLEHLVHLVATQEIQPQVDYRLPLSQAVEAEQLLASGLQFGKIVLVPDDHY